MTPGTYLRIYRENKELTQHQLGEALGNGHPQVVLQPINRTYIPHPAKSKIMAGVTCEKIMIESTTPLLAAE